MLPLKTQSGSKYLKSATSNYFENMTVLKIRIQQRSPGCICVILVSIHAMPPYILENKTKFDIAFRQKGNITTMNYNEWIDLPSLSAHGWTQSDLLEYNKEIEIKDKNMEKGNQPLTVFLLTSEEEALSRKTRMSVEDDNDEDDEKEEEEGLDLFISDKRLSFGNDKNFGIIEVLLILFN